MLQNMYRFQGQCSTALPATDKLQQLSKLGYLPVGFAVSCRAPASAAWPMQGQVRHTKGLHEVTLGGSGRKAGSAKRVSFLVGLLYHSCRCLPR